ncbi:LADA_0H08812g1_1 [Lachancea dasiensis]|uniref:LADA_0H08812g1_1 n=1 Tax=Lachancea dasiensis TaxID=1072105 RepID=A0A1G4K2J8_9SACH|nr:LADA_0H08812g1_1 [Lachancea dasiensis]
MATTEHPYRRNLASATPVKLSTTNKGHNEALVAQQSEHEENIELSEPPSGTVASPRPFATPEAVQYHRKSESSPAPSSFVSPNSSRSNLNASSSSAVELRTGSENGMSSHARRAHRSLDLSHLFLLDNKDTRFTATNESVADLSHQMVGQYLGEAHNSSLVPRLKTIEMYKQNVKKSKDPDVLFQYAQYMLQTALTIDPTEEVEENSTSAEGKQETVSQQEMRKQFLKEAQVYLKKLSVKGYSDAQYLLGDAYSSGAFGRVNNKDAFVLFQSAAKHGHVESAFRTAHCFEEGLGTTRDSRRAVEFLKFAASRNHTSAMYKLGLFSFYGRMGLPNEVTTKQNGIKWLSRAAARATELTSAAPYELAKIYKNGFLDIIIPDLKYAMELYIQAASLGHAQSATGLGKIYEAGNEVVPPDTSLSVHYYTQAALLGEPHAMLGLCAWYLMGAEPVLEKDEKEAFQWALKAAKLGLGKAQFTVGYFYEKGRGCSVEPKSARYWYELAAKNNDSRALNKLNDQNVPLHRKQKSLTALNLFSSASAANLLETDAGTPPKLAQAHTSNQLSVQAPSELSGTGSGQANSVPVQGDTTETSTAPEQPLASSPPTAFQLVGDERATEDTAKPETGAKKEDLDNSANTSSVKKSKKKMVQRRKTRNA